jgi:hypothetical protein
VVGCGVSLFGVFSCCTDPIFTLFTRCCILEHGSSPVFLWTGRNVTSATRVTEKRYMQPMRCVQLTSRHNAFSLKNQPDTKTGTHVQPLYIQPLYIQRLSTPYTMLSSISERMDRGPKRRCDSDLRAIRHLLVKYSEHASLYKLLSDRHIFTLVCRTLPADTIFHMQEVCHQFYTNCKVLKSMGFFTQRVRAEINKLPICEGLSAALEEDGAVLSGSYVLHALLGEVSWYPDDLDVFSIRPKDAVERVLDDQENDAEDEADPNQEPRNPLLRLRPAALADDGEEDIQWFPPDNAISRLMLPICMKDGKVDEMHVYSGTALEELNPAISSVWCYTGWKHKYEVDAKVKGSTSLQHIQLKLDMIETGSEYVRRHFDLSFLKNVYTGKGITIWNRGDLRDRCSSSYYTVPGTKVGRELLGRVTNRLDKYRRRGFSASDQKVHVAPLESETVLEAFPAVRYPVIYEVLGDIILWSAVSVRDVFVMMGMPPTEAARSAMVMADLYHSWCLPHSTLEANSVPRVPYMRVSDVQEAFSKQRIDSTLSALQEVRQLVKERIIESGYGRYTTVPESKIFDVVTGIVMGPVRRLLYQVLPERFSEKGLWTGVQISEGMRNTTLSHILF